MSHQPHKRPGLPVLARYARGDRKALKYWATFIENDPEARAAVAVLRQLDRLFENREVARAASGSTNMAQEIFARFHSNKGSADKNIAHLFYDSQKIPLREGFRPSLVSERRLKYAGKAGTIEISVVPVYPGRFEVTGLFKGVDSRIGANVNLRGRQTIKTDTDDFGFFAFGAVNPGEYKLHLKSGTKEVVIRDLILR
jgi:hypothetical protein